MEWRCGDGEDATMRGGNAARFYVDWVGEGSAA